MHVCMYASLVCNKICNDLNYNFLYQSLAWRRFHNKNRNIAKTLTFRQLNPEIFSHFFKYDLKANIQQCHLWLKTCNCLHPDFCFPVNKNTNAIKTFVILGWHVMKSSQIVLVLVNLLWHVNIIWQLVLALQVQ